MMTIIAILLSLASVGLKNVGKGQGITAGLAVGEGLLAQARSLAVNQSSRARLVIHDDLNDAIPEERQRYRRMMMIMYKELDENGVEQNQWIRFGQPVFLPERVFFSPELSLRNMDTGGLLDTDRHQLSSKVSDNHQCVFYEFNSQGICTTPGAGFVLETGARPTGAKKPRLGKGKPVGGFVVLRNGGTSLIRDIERIPVQENN